MAWNDGKVELTEKQKEMAQIAGIPADRPGLGDEYPKAVYRKGKGEQLYGEPFKTAGLALDVATVSELVVFDEQVEGFDDMLSYGALARKYEPLTPEQMVHTRDRFWIEAPMIGSSYDGFDQTATSTASPRLRFPATVGFHKSSPKTLSAKNLRNESRCACTRTPPRKSLPPT
jgi:hypothetical protein